MGSNCAPLLADIFLYSYEAEFIQKLIKDKIITEAKAFHIFKKFATIDRNYKIFRILQKRWRKNNIHTRK